MLVDRTYSIVALRTFVLAFASNELLPKRRIFIKTGLQEIVINTSYDAQESKTFTKICDTVKKILRS